MRIAISINTAWNIYNFRMNLLKALQADGHKIICIAPEDAYAEKLRAAGFGFYAVKMQNKGTNPVTDLALVRQYYELFQQIKPDVVLQYTIKPNIYGTMAAKLAGIPVINNVSGLGTVFIKKNLISRVALLLYKVAFRSPAKVFFQNNDDRTLFIKHKLVRPEITEVLPGSGVDLNRFKPAAESKRNEPFVFLMIARVLYEKGILEYIEAIRDLKKRGCDARFLLLGAVDEAGNIGIKQAKLQQWVADGIIEYLGTSDAVETKIAAADCVVLPSYREGTPKTLLEAAAMGKPIITTNVPGCRDTVTNGLNGYLCEARNAKGLAEAMRIMLAQPDAQLAKMGRESRKLAETKFDDRIITEKYRTTLGALQNGRQIRAI